MEKIFGLVDEVKKFGLFGKFTVKDGERDSLVEIS